MASIFQNVKIETQYGELNEVLGLFADCMTKMHEQDVDVVKMILSINGSSLEYLTDPSEEQMLIAVKNCGEAIKFIPAEKQTEEIKKAAFESDPFCFRYIDNPSIDMWTKAVATEMSVDDDTCELHPVHCLKDYKDKEGFPIVKLYREYIDHNLYESDFREIIDDLKSLTKIQQRDVWVERLTTMPYMSDIVRDCPIDILKNIIDEILDTYPAYIESCPAEVLTERHVKKYLEEEPRFVNHTVDKMSDLDPVDLYLFALGNAHKRYDIRFIFMTMRDKYKTDGLIVSLCKLPNAANIIDNGFDWIEMNRGRAQLIVEAAGIETLAKLTDQKILDKIIGQLPLLQYISCVMKIKRCKKRIKKEEKKNG